MSPRPQPRPNKEGGPKRERQEEGRQEEGRPFDFLLENISYINEFIKQLIECYVQLGLGFEFRGTRQEIITKIAQEYKLLEDFSILLNLHEIFDTPKVTREVSLAFDVEKFKNKTPEQIVKEVKISILKLLLLAMFFYFGSKKIQLDREKSAEIFNFFINFKNQISNLLNRNFWKPTDSFEILNRAFSIDNVLDLIEKAIISISIRRWLYYFLEIYKTVIKGNPSLNLEEVIEDFYKNGKFVILLRFLLLPREERNGIVIYSPSMSIPIELKNFELTPSYLEINLEDIKKAVLELTKWLIFEQEWSIDPNNIEPDQLNSIRLKLLALLTQVEGIASTNELQRKIEIPRDSKIIGNLSKLGLKISTSKRKISLFEIYGLLEKLLE
ncbi:MAG: hypothetical protein QXD89_00050 [Candidatus Aenigmatarchaeota archaeon]